MGAEIYLSKAKPDMKITVGMIARIFLKVVPSSFFRGKISGGPLFTVGNKRLSVFLL